MSYYEALGLTSEPFSTSPDPAFLYRSSSHQQALQRLEISIRLRRGLCLILGDVGTGKTTLARTVLQQFNGEDDYLFHMILDPSYDSEFQFLTALTRLFNVQPSFKSTQDYRDAIEQYLFQQGVEVGRTVVLMIDEGQKMPPTLLETLRVLLNYETNECKLLQLIIFSQMELLPRVQRIRNFLDRVAMKYMINPLDEQETEEMIQFRLWQAGLASHRALFLPEAIHAVYQATQGYPRRVALLCHNALEQLIMDDRSVVDAGMIERLAHDEVVWSGERIHA